MTLANPVLHSGSSSATAQANYTTASVTIPVGARVLLWVASGKASNLAQVPTGVTHPSIAMTKVADTGSPNSNVKLSLWTGVSNGSAGAFTIAHAAAMDKCLWQVESQSSDIGTPTIAQFAVLSNVVTGSQGATLDTAPKTGSCVFGAFGYNNTSDTVPVGSGYTALGTKLTQSSPTTSLWSEYDNTAPLSQTAPFTFTAATGKGLMAVEVADAVVVTPTLPKAQVWNGAQLVAVKRFDYWDGTQLIQNVDTEVKP